MKTALQLLIPRHLIHLQRSSVRETKLDGTSEQKRLKHCNEYMNRDKPLPCRPWGGLGEHISQRIVAARSAAAGCSDVSVLGRGVRGGVPRAVPWRNFSDSVGISACPLQGIKGT